MQSKAERHLRGSGWGTAGEGIKGKGIRRRWFKNGRNPFIKPSRHVLFEGRVRQQARGEPRWATRRGSRVSIRPNVRSRQLIISHCKSTESRAVIWCPIGKTAHKASRAGSFGTHIIERQKRGPKTSGKRRNDPCFRPLVNPVFGREKYFFSRFDTG